LQALYGVSDVHQRLNLLLVYRELVSWRSSLDGTSQCASRLPTRKERSVPPFVPITLSADPGIW